MLPELNQPQRIQRVDSTLGGLCREIAVRAELRHARGPAPQREYAQERHLIWRERWASGIGLGERGSGAIGEGGEGVEGGVGWLASWSGPAVDVAQRL